MFFSGVPQLAVSFAPSPQPCSDYGKERFGLCNSQRYYFNSKCFAARGLPANEEQFSNRIYEAMVPCPVDPDNSLPPFHSIMNRWTTWNPADYLGTSTVWKIPIAVVAPADRGMSLSAYCQGINGSSDRDPVTYDVENYVVGFIDAVFYDSDIAAPPPTRHHPDPAYSEYNDYWDQYHWAPELEPWSFKHGNCNLVRATTECNQGLHSVSRYRSLGERHVRLRIP